MSVGAGTVGRGAGLVMTVAAAGAAVVVGAGASATVVVVAEPEDSLAAVDDRAGLELEPDVDEPLRARTSRIGSVVAVLPSDGAALSMNFLKMNAGNVPPETLVTPSTFCN